ncbi:protein-methionine-sulfoxide reductase catalytic subunit MsrP [Rubrimonas cliftonensis]|uniref:Sulfoxide reductase catalytic subunit YedY n=1 Tax=Rubrimonas cliftonensis TaxID=89524 RepID=A0A1H3W5R1_9RHOB|nr:protein-methionine-sulfoxide reductase catalytic subunit MsrP [Rubrimonas cliftonensis]SDZ81764.1 sulfoxide reductase catalytic subunit YedY [Rubrimonas cliftonensis]
MNVIRRPDWALPESAATPEAVFLNRRSILRGMGLGAGLLGGASLFGAAARADEGPAAWPGTAPLNPDFADAGRAVTPEDINSTYNNFYEFGSQKQIYDAAQALETRGWTIKIDGLVESPTEISTDDLIASAPIEERVVRHRCVEAWSMVAPWIGFPLSALVERARPLASAKYLRFETFKDPDVARGQRQFWYPWPYVEGVTMAEAANPLAFLVVGAYGKVLHNQFGAPIRLHLPWKFGFKSIKSIVRVSFVEERPVSFWEELQSAEYGFWANVNPEVAHPRWSQATERVLGTDERVPTQLWNGYGAQVAGMYGDLPGEVGERFWR